MVSRGTTVMDKPLWVPMDAQERKGHVDSLLRHLERVEQLEAQKAAASKKFKGQIDEEMEEIQRLRRVLSDDGKQMTLAEATVDQVEASQHTRTTDEQAANALGAVAEKVDDGAVEFEPDQRPTVCGKCGAAVKEFMAGVMCENNQCDWIARPKGMKLDGTPLEVPCAACGGSGVLLEKAEGEDGPGREAPCACKLPKVEEPPTGEATICSSCEKALASAIEKLKALCETCQTSKGGDALEGATEASPLSEQPATIHTGFDPAPGPDVVVDGAGNVVPFTPDPSDADWVDGKTAGDDEPAKKRSRRIRSKIEGAPAEEDDPRPRCKVCHQAPLSADDVERGDGMHQACIDVRPESDEHPAVGGEGGIA